MIVAHILNPPPHFSSATGDKKTSPGDVQFQLGFFTPKGNSNNSRYLGIWYRSHPEIIVWVANRDNPLPANSPGSFGVLNNGDGNLRLMDASGKEYFSTDTPSNSINTRTANLKEGGNLVLVDKEAEDETLWQSFDHPTDTFLPGMKTTQNLKLRSWRSSTDPSTGNYTFEQDEKGVIDGGCVAMNGSEKYWTGKGQSKFFITSGKIADLTNFLLNNRTNSSVGQHKKTIYSKTNSTGVPQYPNFSKMRLVMNHSGEIQRWEDKNGWELIWGEPEGRCSVHNKCGEFGICATSGNDVCGCLDGFEPASADSWSAGDYSDGCIRKVRCKNDGNYTFSPLAVIDVEELDYTTEAKDEEACKQGCIDNKCHCPAYFYTYDRRSGSICYRWTSELVDIKVGYELNNSTNISVDHGITISVKVMSLEPGGETPPNPSQINHRTKSRPREILIISITFSVIAVILLLCSLSYIFYRRTIGRRRGMNIYN